MPDISRRGASAYSSPIRKLTPFADKAKREGKQIFHLNIGQPDIKTPQVAIAKMQSTPVDVLAYSPSKGYLSLRKKLTEYYLRYNIPLDAEDILISTGASEGIFFTFLSCLDEGDEVIIPEPLYANYIGFAEYARCQVVPITSYIDKGFSMPTCEDFESRITPKTKAIMLCNPGNPTGCLYSESALRELATMVKKHNLFLIVDEVYREFSYDDQKFFSALHLEGLEENVIVLDSISKRYSACGARVGMVVTRNKEIMRILTQYSEVRLSPPTFGQILAEYLIDTPQNYLDEVKVEYVKRRNMLYDRLSAMEDVICYLPGGAFYSFVQLPIDDCDRFCRWLLEEFSYDNKTVMLAPGSGFYSTEGLGKQEVRIAYVLNTEDLGKAMDCLEEALKVYPGRTALVRTQR
ncbi:MAG: pyridoxal phosphate-dependent aminotransferase [Saprospiraceae bacterium]